VLVVRAPTEEWVNRRKADNTMPADTEPTVRARKSVEKSDAEEICMRAWQVVGHGEPKEVMELGEKAVPEPGPGEVRILVKAVALGLPDVFMCQEPMLSTQRFLLRLAKRWWGLSLLPAKELISLFVLE
jgi:hypothetical protein